MRRNKKIAKKSQIILKQLWKSSHNNMISRKMWIRRSNKNKKIQVSRQNLTGQIRIIILHSQAIKGNRFSNRRKVLLIQIKNNKSRWLLVPMLQRQTRALKD
jgi:hypothetical protein